MRATVTFVSGENTLTQSRSPNHEFKFVIGEKLPYIEAVFTGAYVGLRHGVYLKKSVLLRQT